MKHIKLNRSYTYLMSRGSQYRPLVWLAICDCIMLVHYKLFKHGNFYGHRKEKDRCNLFAFCSDDIERNPIDQALWTLAQMLLDPQGSAASGPRAPLALLRLKYGDSTVARRALHCLRASMAQA